MRFIAPHAEYSIQLRPPIVDYVVTPHGNQERMLQEALVADFARGGLFAWETEAALARFPKELKRGMPAHDDVILVDEGRTHTIPGVHSPAFRLGLFDSDAAAEQQGWDAETKAFVEQALLESVAHGVDFIHVPVPQLPAPWPSYDTFQKKGVAIAKAIAEMVETLGLDPAEVAAYERQNQDRPTVIAALQASEGAGEPASAELVEA